MDDEEAGGPGGFRLRLGDLGGEEPSPPAAGSDDREALRLLETAARAEPDDPDFHHILGEALLRAGRVREAVGACREAVERDPLNPDYRHALGCALWRLGQVPPAETAFREALQRRPDDPRSLTALGAALVRQHREPEAVSVLERAVKRDAGSADAVSNLGAALWGAGDRPGAVRRFRRAVRLDPGQPDFPLNLARALRSLGQAPEAVKVLQGMVKRWPDRADLLLDLAEACHEAGRPGDAMRAFDEAQDLDPRAIATRPRSREIRDALRLEGVRSEVAGERGDRPGWAAAAIRLPLTAIELFARLRPPVKVASVLALLLVVAVAWATSRVLPHYVTRYLLQDDLAAIARAPLRDDAAVRERLDRAVHRRGLADLLGPEDCHVATAPGWRTISCRYAVAVALLPGLRHTLRFRIEVEEPYLVDPEPLIL